MIQEPVKYSSLKRGTHFWWDENLAIKCDTNSVVLSGKKAGETLDINPEVEVPVSAQPPDFSEESTDHAIGGLEGVFKHIMSIFNPKVAKPCPHCDLELNMDVNEDLSKVACYVCPKCLGIAIGPSLSKPSPEDIFKLKASGNWEKLEKAREALREQLKES